MRKIFYLIVIFGVVGAYGGYKLNDVAKEHGFDWGSAKELSSNITHEMNNAKNPNNTNSEGHNNMTMEEMMSSMNGSLKDKTGENFDKEFLKQMIVHHEGAIEMAKQVQEKSKNPELLKLANDIVTNQSKEVEMMQTWIINYK